MPTVLKSITALFILVSITKLPPPAVRGPVTVVDPVDVNVDTVVDPALIVPEVLILPPVTPPVAVIPVNKEPSPANFVPVVIVPFANISLRNRTVVVPWRPAFALIVPIDRNPAVIVPLFDTVIEPVAVNVFA